MDSTLDLDFNEYQLAVIAAVDRFCEQNDVTAIARNRHQPFPHTLWQELAALGVFAPAAPGLQDAGGALEVCAISEALGRSVFPGPVPATYLAMQVLGEEEAQAVLSGTSLVCLSRSGDTLRPWGTEADIFLVAGTQRVAPGHPPNRITPEK